MGGITDSSAANLTINQTVLTPITANQSTTVSSNFSSPLKVSATDSNGNPLANVFISFNAPGSGASLTFNGGLLTATSGSDGIATSAQITANATPGTYQVTASVTGVSPSAVFTLTNVPNGPSAIQIVSGNAQSAVVNTQFGQTLKVRAVDSNGIGISGVTVTFAAPATGASGSFAGGILTAITDATGIATSALYSANTVAGSYNISATVAGLTPINFNLTNTPDVPVASGLSIFAGGNQTTIVNTAFSDLLKVLVRDKFGNNIPGVTVTFAAPASGASGTFAGGVLTAITDATGIATSPVFTANTIAGGYNVTATVATLTPLNFFLMNQAPTIRSFTIQKGSVGRSFIRYVDIGFDTSSTLNNIVSSIGTASPRLRMKNTGLDGTQNINYNLAGKVAAIDAVIAMDFGAQGIGGDRNSAVGDGSYVIELDRDNDGSFETSLRFFRLLGDVNGDKEVNTLDSSIVAVNIGATGSNLPADINGDGVVNAADALLARRQRGRRITI